MDNRYSVDRIVDGIAALVHDGQGETLYLNADEYGLSVNDVVDVIFETDATIRIIKDEEEKKKRLLQAKSKLHSLFNKGKRN